MSGCEAFVVSSTGDRCGEPEIGTITFACLHEHVSAHRICDACAVKMQQEAADPNDPLICTWCHEGTSAHECRLVIMISRLDSSSAVVQAA